QAVGRLDEALPLLEKGYRLSLQVLGETHPNTLSSLNNLAGIYKAVGRLDEALPLYEKGYRLSLQVLGETHPNTLSSLNNLAIAYAEQGDLEKGIDYLEQLVMGAENLRRAQLSVENRRSVFAQYIGSYFDLSQFYFLQNNYQAAFHTAEKTKARTLLESIAFKLALQHVNFTAKERKKIEQQQTQLAFLNTKIAETGELDKRIALRIKKHALLEKITAFYDDLKQRYPAFASLLEPEIITAEKGRQLLPQNALFISYVQNPKSHQLLVFTLDYAGELHIHDLGVITGLAQTLSVYREALGTTIQGLRQQGQSVWQLADGSFVLGNKPSRDKKPRRVRDVDQISGYLAEKLLRPLAE
ncbi:MAG: tetratricopeptide repeat protein, partial [Candidatus Parabeggiatoa sp.]|nr:tetratricopeptide repeat protein [Candidatus Parabeggiatoa sp.]